jgi:tripartite-type tricarboxylate transporter receptor subunit TctC
MLAVSTVSAGNAGDTIARIVLDQVSKQIGQSFLSRTVPAPVGQSAPPRSRLIHLRHRRPAA